MDYKFHRVVCLTDSMIVRCQIQKESYGFKTFTATRIGEIQENSEPAEWFWIPSGMNPADMITRINKLNEESLTLWKEGSQFLKMYFDEWPLETRSDIETQNLPDRYAIHLTEYEEPNNSESKMNLSVIDIKRFSSYNKLIRTTAIVLGMARIMSFKVGNIINDSECLQVAEEEWIKFVQVELGN